VFFKVGLIPAFVINFFMFVQCPKGGESTAARYFRALSMIEQFRTHWFEKHPGGTLKTRPSKRLSSDVLSRFFNAVEANTSHRAYTGTLAPLEEQVAAGYLADVRLADLPGEGVPQHSTTEPWGQSGVPQDSTTEPFVAFEVPCSQAAPQDLDPLNIDCTPVTDLTPAGAEEFLCSLINPL